MSRLMVPNALSIDLHCTTVRFLAEKAHRRHKLLCWRTTPSMCFHPAFAGDVGMNVIMPAMSTTSRALTATSANDLRAKIEARTAKVGIVGMGYVGLPLALLFSESKFSVTGLDID